MTTIALVSHRTGADGPLVTLLLFARLVLLLEIIVKRAIVGYECFQLKFSDELNPKAAAV